MVLQGYACHGICRTLRAPGAFKPREGAKCLQKVLLRRRYSRREPLPRRAHTGDRVNGNSYQAKRHWAPNSAFLTSWI